MQKESFINHIKGYKLQGGTMKRIVLAIMLSFFLFSGMAVAYNTGHVYRNGVVNSISSDTITVSRLNYKIDSKCRVVIQYKEGGMFHERRARLSDIETGDTVTIKMIGNILYEIIIEGWRR
jgi:hypothetical protein